LSCSDEEISLNFANNAEINTEDICEVLVGATADGPSISTLCNSSEDSPSANTILYHLRMNFEPERLERVANTLLRRDVVELLPEQVEICQTSTCGPTIVTKTTQTHSTTRSEVWNHRVPRLRDTLQTLHAGGVLGVLDGLDLGVKAVYLDCRFYDNKCPTLLQAHNYAYVVPIIRWGKAIQQELSESFNTT
jgi:hypothetical protein